MKTTLRVDYGRMDPTERLEFLRNGIVDDKYVLKRTLQEKVQPTSLLEHIDKLVEEFNQFPEDKQKELMASL